MEAEFKFIKQARRYRLKSRIARRSAKGFNQETGFGEPEAMVTPCVLVYTAILIFDSGKSRYQ
jgi:hypothetical protein